MAPTEASNMSAVNASKLQQVITFVYMWFSTFVTCWPMYTFPRCSSMPPGAIPDRVEFLPPQIGQQIGPIDAD